MLKNLSQLSIAKGGKVSPLLIPGEKISGNGLCNPSIFIDTNGDILCNVRHVHYTLYHSTIDQKFYSGWGCLAYLNPEDDCRLITGNYLCKLDPKTLHIKEYHLINTSKHDITPIWEFVGLEDGRIFRWEDKLYICGVRRDVKEDGEGRMELCELQFIDGEYKEITRDRINPPEFTHLEKNWMPILDQPFHFINWPNPTKVYKVNPLDKGKEKVKSGILDVITSEVITTKTETVNVENLTGRKLNSPLSLRGGSQVITLGDYYVCCVHETHWWHNEFKFKDAMYNHRFIFWDKDWNYVKVSEAFKFMDGQIEFCCGLAEQGDNLLLSFGFVDNAAYVLKMPKSVLDDLDYITEFENE
jgi:hypothetical protein